MTAEAHQPARRAAAFRRDRKPPGRGEVERARISPQFADHGREAGASYPLLHCPQRAARVACFDMDEVLRAKPGRMNPSTFQDRHAVLDPQQRLPAFELGQQEPGPAAVARMGGEQLGEGRHPPPDFWGRGTIERRFDGGGVLTAQKSPSTALRAVPLPGKCRGGYARRGESSAGDQRQASRHTTHNVFVLLLFLSGESASRVNPATREVVGQFEFESRVSS